MIWAFVLSAFSGLAWGAALYYEHKINFQTQQKRVENTEETPEGATDVENEG